MTKATEKELNDRIESLEKKLNDIHAFLEIKLGYKPVELKIKVRQRKNDNIRPRLKLKKEEPKLSIAVYQIIDFWNNSGLHRHRVESSKIYKQSAKRLNSILKGAFWATVDDYVEYRRYKFSKDEIVNSIKNFAVAATNDEYAPYGRRKEFYRKMTLYDFLWNNRSKKDKSLFIYYHENKPELLKFTAKVPEKINKTPEIAKALEIIYIKMFLGGVKPKFTSKEKNDFIKASNNLTDFYSKNRKRLTLPHFDSGNQYVGLATILINAVVADVGENKKSKITTGWLCSELTFSSRLTKYLHNQGLIIT